MSVLQAHDVTVRAGDQVIVHDVALRVAPSQVVGLIGPNGAGKSTVIRALAGLQRPARGRVAFGEQDVTGWSSRELARHVAYVPQDTVIGFDFSARDVVMLGRHPWLGRFSPTRPEDQSIVDGALERVGATAWAQASVQTLSGGERQLVHLARVFAQQAEILLLDEPVSALDLRHQLHVLQLMRSFAQAGGGVAVVLHDLSQAARFCDHLVLLSRGRVVAAGTPAEVLTEARIAAAYGVTVSVRTDSDVDAIRITPLCLTPTDT